MTTALLLSRERGRLFFGVTSQQLPDSPKQLLCPLPASLLTHALQMFCMGNCRHAESTDRTVACKNAPKQTISGGKKHFSRILKCLTNSFFWDAALNTEFRVQQISQQSFYKGKHSHSVAGVIKRNVRFPFPRLAPVSWASGGLPFCPLNIQYSCLDVLEPLLLQNHCWQYPQSQPSAAVGGKDGFWQWTSHTCRQKCIVWLAARLCFPLSQNLLLSSTCWGLPGASVALMVLNLSVKCWA